MVRFLSTLLVFCCIFIFTNNANATIPSCPPVDISDPCQAPWISGQTTTQVVVGTNVCTATLYYCYRYCTPLSSTELQIIYQGADFHDQNCLVGNDLSDFSFILSVKIAIWKEIINNYPPTNGIPPCGELPEKYVIVNFGFANCYRMSASQGWVFMEACNMGTINCQSIYRICRQVSTGNLIYSYVSSTNESVNCSESIVDWIVTAGNFIRPCMRFCDLSY